MWCVHVPEGIIDSSHTFDIVDFRVRKEKVLGRKISGRE